MTSDLAIPRLVDLTFLPYLDKNGLMTDQFDGKVGVYAIYDEAQTLCYIGYSRDVSLSLKQHLVRQPQQCYWIKVQTSDRPSRTLLESIRAAWVAENGSLPIGNGAEDALWSQPIDAKTRMTPTEKDTYVNSDESGKIKTLKQLSRRVEAEVLEALKHRGVQIPVRFDPKLKEEGLLNLK